MTTTSKAFLTQVAFNKGKEEAEADERNIFPTELQQQLENQKTDEESQINKRNENSENIIIMNPPNQIHPNSSDNDNNDTDDDDDISETNDADDDDKPQAWQDGPELHSDGWDTDVEMDFANDNEQHDNTGTNLYKESCLKRQIVPVRYLVESLGEGNIRMRHHYLGGEATKPLADAFKINTVCEEVDLTDNYIDGVGAEYLARTLRDNLFIVNLNVSYNFIGSQGAAAFAEMLEYNTTLKTLCLQGNQLCDIDAQKLAESLKNNMSLICLDLSHNRFTEMGGIYLGQGLALNMGLSDLDLSWNGIRRKGGEAIAKALKTNTSLEILDLSWNGLAQIGGEALGSALKVNKGLKVLDITNNRLNAVAAKSLAAGLTKNQKLETVLMGSNQIGNQGIESILKSVLIHQRLKLLGLEDIKMTTESHEKIRKIMNDRDIMIMYTENGQEQTKVQKTVLAVFDKFINDNADRIEDIFNQMDKDKSGDVTLEELKFGLKDFGLRLTSKQLDMLMDVLDADRSGTIEYTELMNGSSMINNEKEKAKRAKRERQIIADSLAHQQAKLLEEQVHNTNHNKNEENPIKS